MLRSTYHFVALLVACSVASGVRDVASPAAGAADQPMLASEALAAGLLSLEPEDEGAKAGVFAQVADGANATGKTAKCPDVKICAQEGACDVRNLAVITCVEAKNLPSQFMDKVDPYVKFWVDGDKDNKARTTSFNDNEDPIYQWGCPFAYDGALNFDGAVWDDDFGRDELVGDFASSGGVKIDAAFMKEADTNGDGKFGFKVYLFKNGEKVKNKDDKKSTVTFMFEILKDPSYKLTMA